MIFLFWTVIDAWNDFDIYIARFRLMRPKLHVKYVLLGDVFGCQIWLYHSSVSLCLILSKVIRKVAQSKYIALFKQ